MKNLARLLEDPDIYLLWVSGSRHHAELLEWLSALKDGRHRLRLIAFSDELDQLLLAADLVVARAGATSIAELAALSKPTILVPSPYLTGDQQTKNAELLASSGAAVLLTEDKLHEQPLLLSKEIIHLLDDSKLRRRLADNIHGLSVADANARIVAVIEEAAGL